MERLKPGKSYWRGRLSTADLLVPVSLDELFKKYYLHSSYLNEEVNCTQPSVSIPCLKPYKTIFENKSSATDKPQKTWQNLGRVFNSKCERACLFHAITLTTKTAQLKVENSAQIAFWFSLVGSCTPHSCNHPQYQKTCLKSKCYETTILCTAQLSIPEK